MIRFEKPKCLNCEKKCSRRDYIFCSRTCSDNSRRTFKRSATTEQRIERLKESYESKVIKNGAYHCWGWKNRLDKGYGVLGGGSNKMKAHRASWLIHIGLIPKGKFICHSCDNRECTNPNHLFLGTHKSNMKDMIRKRRQKCAMGEKNCKAILKADEVLKIKLLLLHNESFTEIAKKFNVKRHVIYQIKSNKNWKHINLKASLVNQL